MIYFSIYFTIGIAIMMIIMNLVLEIIQEEMEEVRPMGIFLNMVILALIWPITLIAVIKDWLDS